MSEPLRILLHIGTPKTGTTSLQSLFYNSRETLLSHGILYPEVSFFQKHSILAVPYYAAGTMPREFRYSLGDDRDHVEELAMSYWNDIARQVRDTPELHTLILSGEAFFDIVDHERLKNQLAIAFPEAQIEVLCYLRAPPSYYVSLLLQHIKASSRLYWPASENWETKLRGWMSIGALTLREFRPDQLLDGDLVTDALSYIFPDSNPLEADPFSEPKKMAKLNTSLSAEAAHLLVTYRGQIHASSENILMPDSIRLVRALQIAQELLPADSRPSRPRLHANIRERAIKESLSDLMFLRDTLDFTFQGIGSLENVLDEPTRNEAEPQLVEEIIPLNPETLEALRVEVLALLLQGEAMRNPSKNFMKK